MAHEYVEGETFLYLGRSYPLHIVESGNNPIERTDRLCVCRTLLPDIRHRLKCWYVQEAQREIHARCMWFSMTTGYTPKSIRITDARQRWGSCTSTGGLNFQLEAHPGSVRDSGLCYCPRARSSPAARPFEEILGKGKGDHAGL